MANAWRRRMSSSSSIDRRCAGRFTPRSSCGKRLSGTGRSSAGGGVRSDLFSERTGFGSGFGVLTWLGSLGFCSKLGSWASAAAEAGDVMTFLNCGAGSSLGTGDSALAAGLKSSEESGLPGTPRLSRSWAISSADFLRCGRRVICFRFRRSEFDRGRRCLRGRLLHDRGALCRA